jgi:hypothetical protein
MQAQHFVLGFLILNVAPFTGARLGELVWAWFQSPKRARVVGSTGAI